MTEFNIDHFRIVEPKDTRFQRRIAQLKAADKYTRSIEKTVIEAIDNITEKGARSFVIYGEPQSGKTEMMIALTARLLDAGYKAVIVLLNDSVQLLNQNLARFRRSGLDPAPRSFAEVLDPVVDVEKSEIVLFCKKNAKDLKKLIEKTEKVTSKVIIDDEADFATPNAKVNLGDRTKINALVGGLLGDDGIYIGVTATPARLDLNRTFENEAELWVDFEPHPDYKGQTLFFPDLIGDAQNLGYRLTLLRDTYDTPTHLRRALFGFFVNVAYLNTQVNLRDENYSILVHTSGKKADHTDDYKEIIKTFNVLKDNTHKDFTDYVRRIWQLARERYPNHEDAMTAYIVANINRHAVVVMNSDFDKKNMDYETATSPSTLFTVAIGGNIVSRGVTFENLLSMFFTRDVKHKIQQDTYIQRARMFGVRSYDLRYFELTMPENLFLDWHRCFLFHRLALASIKSNNGWPIWLEDSRIAAVSGASIDRSTVDMDSGEMSFRLFDYSAEIDKIASGPGESFEKLEALQSAVGEPSLPNYLVEYIHKFSPRGGRSLAIHSTGSITNYADANPEQIRRPKGLIGKSDREEKKYPDAIHHIKMYRNDAGKARVFYRYHGSIKFLRMRQGN